MFALALAAVTALAQGSPSPTGATFRPSAVVASAQVTVRIVEGASIDFRMLPQDGTRQRHQTSLMIDGQAVPATLIEFP